MNPEIAPHILTGKCRYRDGEPANVLTTEFPSAETPVLSMRASGSLMYHFPNGTYRASGAEHRFDLIPLAPDPRVAREWDAIVNPSGLIFHSSSTVANPEYIRVREVLPEQEEPQSIWLKGYGKPFRITRDKQAEPVAPAFKVGDRVVTHEFNSSGFVPLMREFVGKAGRIVLRSPSGNFLVHRFWWPASALTLVEEPAPESEPEFRYFYSAKEMNKLWRLSRTGRWEWQWCLPRSSDWTHEPNLVETDAAGAPLEGGEE